MIDGRGSYCKGKIPLVSRAITMPKLGQYHCVQALEEPVFQQVCVPFSFSCFGKISGS